MTASELARFLKEEVPILKQAYPGPDRSNPTPYQLLSALDAAVKLLRRCREQMDPMRDPMHPDDLEVLLATLRLVVGEKETP